MKCFSGKSRMRWRRGSSLGALVAVFAMSLNVGSADASLVVSLTDGIRSASAEFEIVGTTLTIILTNTATSDTSAQDRLLAAVVFDIGGGNSVTSATSVFLAPTSSISMDGMVDGSSVDLTSGAFGGDLSGEFGYLNNLQTIQPGWFGGAQYGISATGLDDDFGDGTFGIGTRIDTSAGARLDDPDPPDGSNFGIAGAGLVNVGGMQRPWVVNTNAGDGGAVIITLVVSAGTTLDDITNVGFAYGTSLQGPFLTDIPEPATISLLGIGLVGFALRRRMRA